MTRRYNFYGNFITHFYEKRQSLKYTVYGHGNGGKLSVYPHVKYFNVRLQYCIVLKNKSTAKYNLIPKVTSYTLIVHLEIENLSFEYNIMWLFLGKQSIGKWSLQEMHLFSTVRTGWSRLIPLEHGSFEGNTLV